MTKDANRISARCSNKKRSAACGGASPPLRELTTRLLHHGETETEELVLEALVVSVASDAIMVKLPAVFRITLKVPVPLASGPSGGRTEAPSLLVR